MSKLGRPFVGQAGKSWKTSKYRRKKRCERCRKGGRLLTHHKDRDPKNNYWSNLETLCPACHTKEHGKEIAAAKVEFYSTTANRQKARDAALRVVTLEARARSSAAGMKSWSTKGARANRRAHCVRGGVATWSGESRNRQLGIRRSPEFRERLSTSLKLAWEKRRAKA